MNNTKRIKLPEENVEYTFVFPYKKYYTYVYVGQNEMGRLILMNVKTKRFCTMTPGWFAHLRKTQLVCTKKVDGYIEAKNVERKIIKPIEEQPVQLKIEEIALTVEIPFEKKVVQELRSLSPQMTLTVMSAIKEHPLDLANEIELIFGREDAFTPEFINRVCSTMIKARECYIGKCDVFKTL